MNDAGRIGFVPRGLYSDTTTYEFLDVITYGDASYVAITTTTGNSPTDTNYWQKIASGATDIATTENVGTVKPDGTSIRIKSDGTIYANTPGGSTVTVTTIEPTLIYHEVTISDGTTILRAKFNAEGVATFTEVGLIGNLIFSSDDGRFSITKYVNIPYFGVYNIDLNFWTAVVDISTSTEQFQDEEISIKMDGSVVDTISFSGSTATYKAHLIGTYTFEVTYGWRTFTQEVSITEETTYNVALDGFFAFINATTSSSDLFGETINITSSVAPSATMTFDSEGKASYTALVEGTYILSITHDGEEYRNIVIVDEQKNYTSIFSLWNAPITITTNKSQLYGQPISIKKDGELIGNAFFNSTGIGSFIAPEVGTYTFITTIDWRTFSVDLVVSEETSYTLPFNCYVSPVTITTTSQEFYGRDITVTSDVAPTATITFDGSGNAVYEALIAGEYKFVVDYEDESYIAYVVVSDEGSYSNSIIHWMAIINITTLDEEFYGQPIYVNYEGSEPAGETAFDDTGVGVYKANKPGEYTFSVNYED